MLKIWENLDSENILQLAHSAYEWSLLKIWLPQLSDLETSFQGKRELWAPIFVATKVILEAESKWWNIWKLWIQTCAYNELCTTTKKNPRTVVERSSSTRTKNGCNDGDHWCLCSGRHCATTENKLWKWEGAGSNTITWFYAVLHCSPK